MRDAGRTGYQDEVVYEMAGREMKGQAEPEEEIYLRSPAVCARWLECLKVIKREIEFQHKARRMVLTRYRARLSEREIDEQEFREHSERYAEWKVSVGSVLAGCENRIAEAKEIVSDMEGGGLR